MARTPEVGELGMLDGTMNRALMKCKNPGDLLMCIIGNETQEGQSTLPALDLSHGDLSIHGQANEEGQTLARCEADFSGAQEEGGSISTPLDLGLSSAHEAQPSGFDVPTPAAVDQCLDQALGEQTIGMIPGHAPLVVPQVSQVVPGVLGGGNSQGVHSAWPGRPLPGPIEPRRSGSSSIPNSSTAAQRPPSRPTASRSSANRPTSGLQKATSARNRKVSKPAVRRSPTRQTAAARREAAAKRRAAAAAARHFSEAVQLTGAEQMAAASRKAAVSQYGAMPLLGTGSQFRAALLLEEEALAVAASHAVAASRLATASRLAGGSALTSTRQLAGLSSATPARVGRGPALVRSVEGAAATGTSAPIPVSHIAAPSHSTGVRLAVPSHEVSAAGIVKPNSRTQAGKSQTRKPRTYARAETSLHCHICSRTPSAESPHSPCNNVTNGTCRKAVCKKCFIEFGWDVAAGAFDGQPNGWLCCHCMSACPLRAQCFIYERTSERRRNNTVKHRQPKENGEKARKKKRKVNSGAAVATSAPRNEETAHPAPRAPEIVIPRAPEVSTLSLQPQLPWRSTAISSGRVELLGPTQGSVVSSGGPGSQGHRNTQPEQGGSQAFPNGDLVETQQPVDTQADVSMSIIPSPGGVPATSVHNNLVPLVLTCPPPTALEMAEYPAISSQGSSGSRTESPLMQWDFGSRLTAEAIFPGTASGSSSGMEDLAHVLCPVEDPLGNSFLEAMDTENACIEAQQAEGQQAQSNTCDDADAYIPFDF